jgi:predicted ATPase
VTLIGPGGVGKSRLALEIARAIAAEGVTRVVFVPLAAIQNAAFVAPAVAEALGLSDVTTSDLPSRARVACQDRPTLMVLDNFEHVLDAAPLVSDLVRSVASLQVLVTSRAPLRLRGEREYSVGPLALEVDSNATSPADLARSPAVRLFVERVRDVRPEFRLTPANGPTVTAICRRLDALPLALELAAPWMKVLSLQDLLRRLDHDVLMSTLGPRDLPERQKTMNATVAWSYQLLDASERRAFRRFGALPGLFPIDAAAAVLAGREGAAVRNDEALAATASLIDKSLLLRAESPVVTTCPLYHMLETVRAYAAVELTASGERDDAMEGLVRYASAEASLAATGLLGPSQVEWLDRVREDLETYRAVLTWLLERGRAPEAAAIAWQLKYFWLIRGHPTEGLGWYQQILNVPSLPLPAELRALAGAAVLWYTQGDVDRARAALSRALSLPHAPEDGNVVAHAEYLFGHVEHASGDLSAARRWFVRSADQFRALDIPAGIGNALSGQAVVALASGDAAQAERLLDQATSVLRKAGPWFLTWALYVRAVLAVRHGKPDQAIALVRESLAHIRELHDKFAFVYALAPLFIAAVLKADDTWAARILAVRDTVTERTGVTVVDPFLAPLRDRAEQEARARLGAEEWSEAYAAGRAISVDALIKDVDRVSRARGRS